MILISNQIAWNGKFTWLNTFINWTLGTCSSQEFNRNRTNEIAIMPKLWIEQWRVCHVFTHNCMYNHPKIVDFWHIEIWMFAIDDSIYWTLEIEQNCRKKINIKSDSIVMQTKVIFETTIWTNFKLIVMRWLQNS